MVPREWVCEGDKWFKPLMKASEAELESILTLYGPPTSPC